SAAWCEELLQSVAEATFAVGEEQQKLTASCGLSEAIAGETFDVLLARCERTLALARASGHGQIVTSDEVDRDADAWAAFAADGKLFESTVARDVMHLCPLLLH